MPGASGPDDGERSIPTPGRLIGAGLDLVVRTTGQLRPASLALGLQLLGVLGPVVVLVMVLLDRNRTDALVALFGGTTVVSPDDQAIESSVAVGLFIAALGSAAILVEGRLIAASLLAGRLVGRPVGVREALRRSRQTFWRAVRASLAIQVPIAFVVAAFGEMVGQADLDPILWSIVSGVVTALLSAPFAFATSGIVLGDGSVSAALRRSVQLAGRRWRLAFVVALFAGFAQVLLPFGLLAGLDALGRIVSAFGLTIHSVALVTFATLVVVLLAVVAIGTLLFTVNAIVLGPEVVAFVALTGDTRGLEKARDAAVALDPRARRAARWLSLPMAIGIGVAVVVSMSAISDVVRAG